MSNEQTAVQTVESQEQTDIQKLDAQIATMEQDGKELFADAIQTLKDKRAVLVTEAEEKAKATKAEVKTAEISTESTWVKYSGYVWEAVKGVGIAAVIWKLFLS